MHLRSLILPLAAVATTCMWADEGIWLFDQVPQARLRQSHGVTLSEPLLERLRLSSIRMNNGGSGSFVSPDGLIFTNHHVASECIQQLSSKEADYMKNGFQAATREAEKPCPDLEVNVLLKIDDVTAKVKAAAEAEKDFAAISRLTKAQMSRLEKECAATTGNRCDVVTLYSGEVFHLYQYKKYTDVRLVFAPENAIAMFGGDPDNFTYPRYCLDISFLRAYENGKPAVVKNFLPWSRKGAREGELTLVSGHPGSTGRLATMAELEFNRNIAFPFAISRQQGLIEELLRYGALSAENKRIAGDELFSVQNSFKAYTGFLAGLREADLMNRKRDEEQTLRAHVAADPKLAKGYGATWDRVAQAYAELTKIYKPYSLLESSPARASTLFSLARTLVRMNEETKKPSETRLREFRETALEPKRQFIQSDIPLYASMETTVLAFYLGTLRQHLGADHPVVVSVLAGKEPLAAAQAYVEGSKLADLSYRKQLLADGKLLEASRDPMLELIRRIDPEARRLRTIFEDKVEAAIYESASKIAAIRFAKFGTEAYPDATFTLRLSFGAVKGYQNAEGKPVPYATNFTGLFGRVTGKEPYALPQRWLDARRKLKSSTQFNFVTTADTHGGNSGSPTVNTRGEVVGILFDGNLEGLPNRFVYRDSRERSVHVSTAAITEALRVVYGAQPLLKELGVASGR
ncbi:MAG: S46 family peptidase [Bryobacterales bacterium]|nr:S46 family peptidase [Bryobacterales bacterium]